MNFVHPWTPPPAGKSKILDATISTEIARIHFFYLESNAAKTRIVNLETTIHNCNVTIKLQEEHIKVLKQNQTEFINKKHHINTPTGSQSQCGANTCSYASTGCFSRSGSSLPCLSHCPHRHHQQTPRQPQRDTGVEQLVLLKEIKSYLNNIQDGIRLVAANAVIPEQTVQTPEVNKPTELMTHVCVNTNPDHIEVVSVDIVN